MRSHGVLNFPGPGSPQSAAIAFKNCGVLSSPMFQTAARACVRYGHPETSRPQVTTRDQVDYLEAAARMRSHGIVGFPDPVFSDGNVNFPVPPAMNTYSTQFRRAREVCELLIPPGLPYSKQAEGVQ
jgi:hypothetical protein